MHRGVYREESHRRLGNKFYNSAEARELRNLINEFRSKIETCIRRINEIIEEIDKRFSCNCKPM
ncbi:MAG: hypothetical protein V6S10_02445 [Candidatus Methanoglobus sp.]